MATDQSRRTSCKVRWTSDPAVAAWRTDCMGWSISERIQTISKDVLQVNQGSLYPALHRLEHRGWVKAEWDVSELGRRARFTLLLAAGRKQLEVETEDWGRLSEAINRVLRMA